jgi:hypothetical protein
MSENRTKKNDDENSIDAVEWMLAIDFDSIEVRHARPNILFKYEAVLDESLIRLKRGD